MYSSDETPFDWSSVYFWVLIVNRIVKKVKHFLFVSVWIYIHVVTANGIAQYGSSSSSSSSNKMKRVPPSSAAAASRSREVRRVEAAAGVLAIRLRCFIVVAPSSTSFGFTREP